MSWPFVSHGFVDFVFGGGGNACFPPGACLPALRGLNLHHQLNPFSSGLVSLSACGELKISSQLGASTDGALGWSVLQAGQVNQLQRFEKLKL